MKHLLTILLILISGSKIYSQVWVYDYPDTIVYTEVNGRNFRSFMYDVNVVQGDSTYNSYVLADYNTFPDGNRSMMTEWNHSTTFSFDGEMTIEVMKKDSLYPADWIKIAKKDFLKMKDMFIKGEV